MKSECLLTCSEVARDHRYAETVRPGQDRGPGAGEAANLRDYNFGTLKDDALKTFFDLAQEYETLENFYRVSVSVIKEFFGLDSRLYLICPEGDLELVCDSLQGVYPDKPPPPPHVHLDSQAYWRDDSWVVPIRGNLLLVDRLPFYAKDQAIGMLEVFPEARLSESDRFFLEKYANRLGYNLHNKIISWQNIQHIRFINSLVADIEHNVIIPNISLSLYLRHLRDKIKTLKELECIVRSQGPEGIRTGPRTSSATWWRKWRRITSPWSGITKG